MPYPKKKIKPSYDKANAKDYALFLVSLRAQSTAQLRQKLLRKGYAEDEVLMAIQRLTELGYLNDQQFAQIYFENLKKYKHFGYYGIKKKLMLKALENKLIDQLLKTLTLKEEQGIAERFLSS